MPELQTLAPVAEADVAGVGAEVVAEDAEPETLYDQPLPERGVVRVSGPFTVEAIPPAAFMPPLGAGSETESFSRRADALRESLRSVDVLIALPEARAHRFSEALGGDQIPRGVDGDL